MTVFIHVATYFLLFFVAFMAGFLGAISGGGGLLTLPVILAIGLPPQVALGTNKMLAAFTTFSSSLVFFKKGFFCPNLWLPAIISTILSAIAGVLFVRFTSPHFLNKALPILIAISAIYTIFFSHSNMKKSEMYDRGDFFKPGILSSSMLAGMLGFYSSFAGVGLGIFWTSALQFFYKLKIISALGVARGICFVSNLTSFVCFILFGEVNYFIGFTMGISMAIGAYLGAHSAIKVGGGFIKAVIAFVSIGTAFYLLFKV